jgi:two-component system KDP operon response regulator KdpE
VAGIEAMPCASDWRLAVRCLTSHNISLIVLSVDKSQERKALFQTLRDLTEIPVVAMGVGKDADQVVWYLENGAADYVTPTMPVGVLAGKLALLLRRRPAQSGTIIGLGDLVIDAGRRMVTRGRKTISLTPLEFSLLQVLAENAGRACSRHMLLEKVWGQEFQDCAHYLRLYIGYLRQKLEVDPGRPRYILTEWGYGYRLVEPRRAGRQPSAQPALRPAPSP